MKNNLKMILLLILSIISTNSQAQSSLNESEKARELVRVMRNRDDGKTRYSEMWLITCRFSIRNGKRTASSNPIRKNIETISIDVGDNLENTFSLGIINNPPSEKNMAFLQKDYDQEGKESDQWMYFPALKKLKRIVSPGNNRPKDGSVFGTEIAYEDIEKLHLSNYKFSFEGEEKVDNYNCDKIIAYPTDTYSRKTSYSKVIFWIDKKTKIPIKRELYDKPGKLIKTFYSKNIQQIDNVWISKIRITVNHQNKYMTMEKAVKLAVNIPIEENLVSLRAVKDFSYRESILNAIRIQAK